ncbi:MAG: FliM/FliN family flagellar motor switch protein [Myxococcales bacterium]|nr:FliM/FliN family flagellar motor switch protein [Myxococcota bacterium]MDW8283362.1 FliM/FliN family flagellar motor switch protein [Myxococcales bacterium]
MDPLLTQSEMDALREAMHDRGGAPLVRSVDLCADDRLLRRALPQIEEAGAHAAECLRLSFTRALRGAVTVSPQPAEILLAEDARALEERTAGRLVLSCEPSQADVPLLLDVQLVLLHVQREFGGSLEANNPGRGELTGLERGLLARLGPSLAEALSRAFVGLGLRLRSRHAAARACVTNSWPRQASVIALSWRVAVGSVSAGVHLLLPHVVIEALRAQLSGERPGGRDLRWRTQLVEQLRMVEIEVIAELGRAQSTLSQILSLQVGEVLRLDRSLTEQVPVLIDNRVKLRGRPGTRGDTVTLTIEEIGES